MDMGNEATGVVMRGVGVILISGATGSTSVPISLLCEKLAKLGYYTLAPNIFNLESLEAINMTRCIKEASTVINSMKEKGVSKVAAIGFCVGASVVVDLASHGSIDAGFLVQPSLVAAKALRGVTVPLYIVGAELDEFCDSKMIDKYRKVLGEIGNKGKSSILLGVSHNWLAPATTTCIYKR